MHALVIEDSERGLGAIERALQELGITYEIACSYGLAEAKIRNLRPYDLIILDDRLERDDQRVDSGYRLIPEIRRVRPEALLIGSSNTEEGVLRKLHEEIPARRISKILVSRTSEELQEILKDEKRI